MMKQYFVIFAVDCLITVTYSTFLSRKIKTYPKVTNILVQTMKCKKKKVIDTSPTQHKLFLRFSPYHFF